MNELTFSSAKTDDDGLLSGQYWAELRIFAEVARAKSFNRAAERLGMSQPTIGRKVRRLQDLIGAQLFVSTKRGVKLTRRGEELAAALLILDQSLFSLASDLKARANDTEGIVSVSITDGMAAFFAAPAVPAFVEQYPKVQLIFKNMGNLNDLRENRTDMMLSFTPSYRPDIECRQLGCLHFIPVASKAYIARHGMPTRDRIADHRFLQSYFYQGGAPVWRDWQALCGQGQVVHSCENSFAYGMLVRHGVGIGFLGSYAIRDPAAVALDLGVGATLQMYGLALKERLESRPVRLVYDWLGHTFSETNPWFQSKLDLSVLPESMEPLHMMR